MHESSNPSPPASSADHGSPTVVWLIEGREIYGVQRAILSLTLGIKRAGANPIIISLNPGEGIDACRDHGLTTQTLGMGAFPSLHESRTQLSKIFCLFRIMQFQQQVQRKLLPVLKQQPIHALHTLNFNLLAATGCCAQYFHIPCFWEMTNCLNDHYPFHINQRIYNWTLQRHRIHVLANSRYTSRTLGTTKAPINILYLGVNEELFSPQHPNPVTRESLGIPADSLVALIVARLDESKGQDRVLQALIRQRHQYPRVDLVLVGGAVNEQYTARIKQLAVEAGISDRIHLVGSVPDPERYYGLADFTISSGLVAESYGLSVVESMMSGKPVLAHALGGPSETVLNGQTGWLIPTASVDDLFLGLKRALDDRSRWNDMGHKAHQHALDNFSISQQVKRYLAFVRNPDHASV